MQNDIIKEDLLSVVTKFRQKPTVGLFKLPMRLQMKSSPMNMKMHRGNLFLTNFTFDLCIVALLMQLQCLISFEHRFAMALEELSLIVIGQVVPKSKSQ